MFAGAMLNEGCEIVKEFACDDDDVELSSLRPISKHISELTAYFNTLYSCFYNAQAHIQHKEFGLCIRFHLAG